MQYTIALVSVALAFAVRLALDSALGGNRPFITFFLAVAVSAWFGGVGPAFLGVVLGYLLGDWFFIYPRGSLFGMAPIDVVAVANYWLVSTIILFFSHALRRATARRQAQAKELAEVAALADMAQTMVCDQNLRIVRWSSGAWRLYGFSPGEAIGQISYELLHTQFPQPLELIRQTLLAKGRWEGQLIRQGRNGSAVTVSSLWVLRWGELGTASWTVLQVDNVHWAPAAAGQKASCRNEKAGLGPAENS